MPFFKNIGTTELIIIVLLLVVFFGGKRLTKFARGLGESSKELKKAKREMKGAIDDFKKDEPPEEKKIEEEKGEENKEAEEKKTEEKEGGA